jgi:hypothetical protein
MQQRSPVGRGPSSKTCRRGAAHRPAGLDGTVQVNVDRPFGRHQDQGEDGKSDLYPLRASCLGRHWTHSPLSRRSRAQRPYAPYRIEVDRRPGNRDGLHGNTNRRAMDGGKQIRPGCRSGQRTDTNEKPKTTDRHEDCACALKQDKEQAGESNDPRAAFHIIILWTNTAQRVMFEQGCSPSSCL